jgi:hypothetical protein
MDRAFRLESCKRCKGKWRPHEWQCKNTRDIDSNRKWMWRQVEKMLVMSIMDPL